MQMQSVKPVLSACMEDSQTAALHFDLSKQFPDEFIISVTNFKCYNMMLVQKLGYALGWA